MNDDILITPELIDVLEGGAKTIGVELLNSELAVLRRELKKCQKKKMELKGKYEQLRK